MNVLDDTGLGHAKNIVVVFQLLRMVREQGASIIFFSKLVLLDHGAHRSIEDEDLLFQRFDDIERSRFLEIVDHNLLGLVRRSPDKRCKEGG
jgi:hypothetical protein